MCPDQGFTASAQYNEQGLLATRKDTREKPGSGTARFDLGHSQDVHTNRPARSPPTTTDDLPERPPGRHLPGHHSRRSPFLLLANTSSIHPRGFSTTAAALARVTPKAQVKKPAGQKVGKPMDSAAARAQRKKRRSQMEAKLDPKVSGLMKFIYAGSQVQAPLRMARNRWLRHWTIHRAWQLFRRREQASAEREMMRMQQSMSHACEVLRNMGGPGTRPEGWLYRKAMEKKGIWGRDAVPIEYARPMVETPGNKPWNHEWKRS
ncbi:hypothetical protein SLS53_007915 [Cytospora paraplurivora]|uniref:Uncharacterized protein n=1 Tax=Cytospora paraplurivora TaxID=2898453 RepID=A0AAN9TZI4_9PEZI